MPLANKTRAFRRCTTARPTGPIRGSIGHTRGSILFPGSVMRPACSLRALRARDARRSTDAMCMGVRPAGLKVQGRFKVCAPGLLAEYPVVSCLKITVQGRETTQYSDIGSGTNVSNPAFEVRTDSKPRCVVPALEACGREERQQLIEARLAEARHSGGGRCPQKFGQLAARRVRVGRSGRGSGAERPTVCPFARAVQGHIFLL
jgi:hypothetical protein